MNDAELVEWLSTGRVMVVGTQTRLDFEQSELVVNTNDYWAMHRALYDPCRAPDATLCLYCPWEACRRPPRAPKVRRRRG